MQDNLWFMIWTWARPSPLSQDSLRLLQHSCSHSQAKPCTKTSKMTSDIQGLLSPGILLSICNYIIKCSISNSVLLGILIFQKATMWTQCQSLRKVGPHFFVRFRRYFTIALNFWACSVHKSLKISWQKSPEVRKICIWFVKTFQF